MRNFFHYITYPLPFKYLRNLAQVNPLIINYHVVADTRLPHIINLYKYRTVSQFIADLDFLTRNFHPLGLPEFLQCIRTKSILPKSSFLLTFDDGLKEIYEIVAPILKRKNLTATFFLTTNFVDNQELGYDGKKSLLIDYLEIPENSNAWTHVSSFLGLECNDIVNLKKAIIKISYKERFLIDRIAAELKYDFDYFLKKNKPYVTSDQIHELINQGFTFGAHSIDHPRFSELSLNEQINQADSSIRKVTEKYSLPYKVFAFPYSDNQVSIDFFESMSSKVEATFGTHGLLQDQIINNFQRISVEKSNQYAHKVLKFHYIRKIIYKFLGRDKILRKYSNQS